MFQCFSLCFLVLQSLFETQACKLAKPLYRSWVNLLRLSWKQSSSCGSRKCVTSATSLENLCSLCLQDCIFNVLERTVCEDVKKNVRSLGSCPFVFIGLSRSCKISLSVQPFSEKKQLAASAKSEVAVRVHHRANFIWNHSSWKENARASKRASVGTCMHLKEVAMTFSWAAAW